MARYRPAYERSHHRLASRLGGASVAVGAIDALDAVWESLRSRARDANPAT